jgi:hypothetical protein
MSILSPETLAYIEENFPEYSTFVTEDGGLFGQDVRDLLIRAAQQKFTPARFRAEYKQTQYYLTTAPKIKAWNAKPPAAKQEDTDLMYASIAEAYGEVLPDEAQGRKIATSAARLGLSGTQLRNFVFAESLRLSGPIRNKLKFSEEGQKIRATLREFGYTPQEEELNAALTGTSYKGMPMNTESLLNKARLTAKGQYMHLAPQIDAGLSLEDIFKNYRQYAAQTLQIDPNEIDFAKDPKWSAAFGDSNTGPLSLSAWVSKLKSEDQYGWRFTPEANKQVSGVVSTLERAFGLVR